MREGSRRQLLYGEGSRFFLQRSGSNVMLMLLLSEHIDPWVKMCRNYTINVFSRWASALHCPYFFIPSLSQSAPPLSLSLCLAHMQGEWVWESDDSSVAYLIFDHIWVARKSIFLCLCSGEEPPMQRQNEELFSAFLFSSVHNKGVQFESWGRFIIIRTDTGPSFTKQLQRIHLFRCFYEQLLQAFSFLHDSTDLSTCINNVQVLLPDFHSLNKQDRTTWCPWFFFPPTFRESIEMAVYTYFSEKMNYRTIFKAAVLAHTLV